MRTRLFLSAAVATLSLCLSQGYAQQAGRQPAGGEATKQGESARMQKPDEKGATSQRRDERAQEQRREHGAQQTAEKSERHGASAKDEQKHEATKAEEKSEAAKGGEKHGSAKKGEKHGAGKNDERRGAISDEDSRAAAAQRGQNSDRQERTGERASERTGAGPNERTGAAAAENERRGAQPEGERTGRFGQAERGQAERGQAERQQAERQQAERAQAEREQAQRAQAERGQIQRRGENAPGVAEQQQRGAERSLRGSETARGAEATQRGGRGEAYGYAGREGQGGRLQLSERQQNQVRQILEQRGARSFTRNDFNLQIGAVVPPNVQFYPLPPDVLAMAPQFRGYDYVMVDNDVAIIDPGTREVVTVLGEGGPPAATYGYEEREGGGYYGGPGGYERRQGRAYGTARRDEEGYRGGGARERRGEAYGYAPRVRLDTRQERALYRGIISEARSNLRQVCVRVGDRVPESVDIEPVPRNIAAEAPDAERFDYFVLNDQVVLVDPDTRTVVDMIEQPR
ncbi:DUF1236 domain-containing protein [Methylocystis sp. IM3]|uniref:DUF1236 domain-containing protein n=1 Tax=unclassified Methylocystis TaxID=2625913 RepID=UPI0030F70C0F